MSIRIYALAKQLKVDSKSLVDICKDIGIKGKGSALASLSEDEVEQVNAFLKSGAPQPKVAVDVGTLEPVMARPAVTDYGRVPVLRPSAPARQSTERKPSEVEPAVATARTVESVEATDGPGDGDMDASVAVAEPPQGTTPLEIAVPEMPQETEAAASEGVSAPIASDEASVAIVAQPELAAESAVADTLRAPATPNLAATSAAPVAPPTPPSPTAPPAPSAPLGGPVRREDYLSPGGSRLQEIRQLAKKRSKPDGSDDDGRGAATKKTPTKKPGVPSIALAPMPAMPEPRTKKKAAEPAPQKPDIKLPMDALRAASKGGSRPLSEHLRMHEEKRAEAASRKKRGAAPATTPSAEEAAKTADHKRKARAPGKGEGFETEDRDFDAKLRKKRSGAAARRKRLDSEDDSSSQRGGRRFRRSAKKVNTAAPRKSDVVVQLPCSVRDFAQEIGVPAQRILGECIKLGFVLTINSAVDTDTAELLADALGVQIDVRAERSLEERLIAPMEELEDAAESLQPRPPIVTFLGHVDHGKTSLLDRILNLNVVAGEKGGITQHIRAYRIHTEKGDITFVDTPGHEAFTEMRARGANVTDIAVLIVAADDGVMPQTEEAISHARAAEVPIVVALNKIDLPGVKVDRALQSLAANELLPSEWGGDVEVVRTSAMTGEGVEQLLDTLLTVAELHELKANPERSATGVCLEAELQPGRGVVCKFLVQKGTLRVGDVVVCGSAHGRVKAMYDTLDPHKQYEEAGPSTPVNLTGLGSAPNAGDRFHVLESISEARMIAEGRADEQRTQELVETPSHVTLENLHQRLGRDNVQTLNVILRADVRGSIEAIRKELTKLEHPEVQVKILQATVGGITEADVHLADASDAIIIGFSVVPDEGARSLAERKGVQVRRYDIIYKLTADLKAALEGMLRPEEREQELGRALVQRVFHISRIGSVAGCRVLAGNMTRDARVRLIRENRIIGDYPIDTLKREKDDAKEVREGYECGIKLKGYNDVKEGDIFEAYRVEEVARTF